jgi:hypothetical protein
VPSSASTSASVAIFHSSSEPTDLVSGLVDTSASKSSNPNVRKMRSTKSMSSRSVSTICDGSQKM